MPNDPSYAIDDIGPWSEVKLAIVRDYASAYSKILSAQKRFHHVYVDAFAGAGVSISRASGQFVPGSPLNALNVNPAFREYYLVDLDSSKVEVLKDIVGDRENVHIHRGDGNQVLLKKVFPNIQYGDYRRGLCLLDPYRLDLDWKVIETAGSMKTIELFLNFPIMHMNRNVLRHNPDTVDPKERARMTAYWGDDSWREMVYDKDALLFNEMELKTASNKDVTEAFRKRLAEVAGFRYVPEPMPMKAKNGAIVYYLYFAAQKPVAKKIVQDIFRKYGA